MSRRRRETHVKNQNTTGLNCGGTSVLHVGISEPNQDVVLCATVQVMEQTPDVLLDDVALFDQPVPPPRSVMLTYIKWQHRHH